MSYNNNDNLITNLFSVGFFLLLVTVPIISYAVGNPTNPTNSASMIVNVLCAAINELTGPVGRAITVIIVISLGIMLLLGKVTWGVAIALAVGMGIIFGAKDLVSLLSGGGGAPLCV